MRVMLVAPAMQVVRHKSQFVGIYTGLMRYNLVEAAQVERLDLKSALRMMLVQRVQKARWELVRCSIDQISESWKLENERSQWSPSLVLCLCHVGRLHEFEVCTITVSFRKLHVPSHLEATDMLEAGRIRKDIGPAIQIEPEPLAVQGFDANVAE